MPTYNFERATGECYEEFMSIAELDQYIIDNKVTLIPSAPGIVSGIGVSGRKPDSAFRDILKNVKREHSRGVSKSTVNTW